MRALLAFAGVVILAEAIFIVSLMGGDDAPRSGGDGLEPAVVTRTVVINGPGAAAAPSKPVDPGTETDDPDELKRLLAASRKETAEVYKVLRSAQERMQKRSIELERLRREVASMRAIDGSRANAPPNPRPEVSDAELTTEEQIQRLQHLGQALYEDFWTAGQPMPADVLPELTAGQRAAVDQAMRDEEPRMLAAVRSFLRRHLGDKAPADLDTMPPNTLVTTVVTPLLSRGWVTLSAQSPLTHLQILRRKKGLEEVLGGEHAMTQLSRVAANVRRETWGQLDRSLAPDQARQVREKHLPLGYYRYASGWRLVLYNTNSY